MLAPAPGKIAIVGGGGMRTPLLVGTLVRRAAEVGLGTIALTDTDPVRLSILGGLSARIAREIDPAVRVVPTSSAEAAIEGAAWVVTTIRAGGEGARARDERIAIDLGLIGQETTGPAGFTMAARNLPALEDICRTVRRAAPSAWILNFTNPSGLITQALRDRGFERVIGICDSPPALVARIAAFLGLPPSGIRAEVFGLNHLSWVGSVHNGERDLLPDLVMDPRFASRVLPLFDPALVESLGLAPVEYLFYYYHREKALEGMRGATATRGEKIGGWNADLLSSLDRLDPTHRFDRCLGEALDSLASYVSRRNSTYMDYARPAGCPAPSRSPAGTAGDLIEQEGEGYAGVALDLIGALSLGDPARIALSVPSMGSIPGLSPEDVVEVTCEVSTEGIRPVPPGRIPEEARALMVQVKLYERLACEAIRRRSLREAARALMSHPLVGSFSLARRYIDRVFALADPWLADWREA